MQRLSCRDTLRQEEETPRAGVCGVWECRWAPPRPATPATPRHALPGQTRLGWAGPGQGHGQGKSIDANFGSLKWKWSDGTSKTPVPVRGEEGGGGEEGAWAADVAGT